jgi:aminoglycoside N3'-acetyltransferase/aminopeptidase-like protein
MRALNRAKKPPRVASLRAFGEPRAGDGQESASAASSMAQPQEFFSASRVMADIRAIVGHTRWMTSPEITRAAHYIKNSLKRVPGLVDVEVIDFLSDGRTAYGGWVMPKCWDVRTATLKVAIGQPRHGTVFADYRANPFSLMMWSPATPPQGIEAPVAVVSKPFKNGSSLKGKFALVELTQDANAVLEWAAESGAVGVISDTMIIRKGIKEGAYLDDAIQYWNYTNPQWDGAPRLPAFGLSPQTGKSLRKMLAPNPDLRLHAQVDAQLYDGTLPLVTARLPGKSHSDFVLTAHMDEPGASDNASGTALAMEVLRCFAERAAKRGELPEIGVRFYASVEARGLQAYLNTRSVGRNAVVAGLNLDMIGYDHTDGRTKLDLASAQPATPSALEVLMCELCAREAKNKPLFKWSSSRAVEVDDCQFAGLPFNAPMICVMQAPDRTYHSSLDTPENLSASHLKRMGRLVLETVRFYCDSVPDEIVAFGARAFEQYAARIRGGSAGAHKLPGEAKAVFAQLLELFPEEVITPHAQMVAEMRKNNLLVKNYLSPRYAFEEQIGGWIAELKRLSAELPAAVPAPLPRARVPEALAKIARELVPLKNFAGYVAFEDLTRAEKAELKKTCGISASWAAPGWLQMALDLSSGKRTLLEIHSLLQESSRVDVQALVAAMRFLHTRGQVRFRTYLTHADVIAAIRRAGIRTGDVIVAHSALSDFGYLAGGADTLINCLLEAVGPTGTVCVPTHSLNWIGKTPYDPKTSPSLTGAVPAAFLRRPNAVRSLHPTHSVAAIGARAQELLDGHDHRVAPQARNGFWGKFVDAGGKVLMLCKLQSNTLLHGAELWAGVPYPPCEVHYLKDGQRIETTMPGLPWHVHAFDLAHDALRARGRLCSVKLGESQIHSMDAGEAVKALMDFLKKDLTLAIRDKCQCGYCQYLRKHIKS